VQSVAQFIANHHCYRQFRRPYSNSAQQLQNEMLNVVIGDLLHLRINGISVEVQTETDKKIRAYNESSGFMTQA